MSRPRCCPLSAAVIALALAACGGSGSSATSSSSPTATATATATSTSSSTSSASVTGQMTTATTSSNAQANASSTSSAQSSAARVPDTNVRLPAAFTITAGGALQPPGIAAPKHTDIALTVTSGDGHEHQLVLETPHRYHATVRPGAPARLLLKELPDGSYAIDVDHVARGRLIVGAAPGP